MDNARMYARIVAIVAGIVYVILFVMQFSYRSQAIMFARWGALIVLGFAWIYSSSKPR